jgi:hypothetical protein
MHCHRNPVTVILGAGEKIVMPLRIRARLLLSALMLQSMFGEANAEYYNCDVPGALAEVSKKMSSSSSKEIEATPMAGGLIINTWSVSRQNGKVVYVVGHIYSEVVGGEVKIIKMKNGDIAVRLDSEYSSVDSDGTTETSYFVFCRDQTFLTVPVPYFATTGIEVNNFAEKLKKQIMTDPKLAPF